jgi:hypothetical protein
MRKAIIILIIVLLILVSGVILFKQKLMTNFTVTTTVTNPPTTTLETIPPATDQGKNVTNASAKNTVSEPSSSCAKEGEKIGAVGMPSSCCAGLKEVGGWSGGYNGDCSLPPPPTGLSICANCGDGICDTYNGENKCNCSQDCSGNETPCVDYYQDITNPEKESCCKKFKAIKIALYQDDCSITPNSAPPVNKCLLCGDGRCDQGVYMENKCNCPEDCGGQNQQMNVPVTTPVTTPNNNYTHYTVKQLTHLAGEVPDGTLAQADGTVENGDIVASYCSNEIYLKDDTGYIRLVMQKSELTNSLGKKISIKGVYKWDTCEAMCICGPQITVSKIGNAE